MKIEREKNAIKGTVTGIASQIVNVLFPFAIRSVFIRIIGIDYAGLDTLFKSVLQILNLTELGVGSALVFNMYKPITTGNKVKICALMKLYKVYYGAIGVAILAIGIALTPFLPTLIKGDIPSDLNLYVLYYLNLGVSVVSYWLFSYRSAILNAHQRIDVINIVTIIVNTTKYVLQITSIFIFKNYYIYLIISLLSQIILNVITAFAANKMFPDYQPRGSIPLDERKEINAMVRDLFTAKVGGVVLTSVDTIVISRFLGLRLLAIYNNYYYIMTALFAFFMVFYNACRAGIANELIIEGEEKKVRDFNKLTFIVFFCLNVCVSCLLNLFQPFMKMWIGTDYLLEDSSVVLFCIYYVVYEIPVFWSVYKDAAGVWRQDRFRPLIGAIVNLAVNIMLVNIIGINGVIISTIISEVFICIPWLLYTLKKNVLPLQLKEVAIKTMAYIGCMLLSAAVTNFTCGLVSFQGVLELVIKLIISTLISALLWCVIFCRFNEFTESLHMLRRITERGK